MGYEVKYYVIEKNDINEPSEWAKNKKFARLVGMFDLCKDDAISRITREYPNTDYYIFSDDGNTPIIEDKYNQELKEIPLKDMIRIVDSVIRTEDYYRRRIPLLDFLKSFDSPEWNVVILHYGY